MKCNVGRTEQIIRIAAGTAAIILGLYFRNWWGLIGFLPITTGFIGYCPINEILGISTCQDTKKE